MGILQQWRDKAYNEKANKGDLQRMWADYFAKEKSIYAEILKNPDEVVTGTQVSWTGSTIPSRSPILLRKWMRIQS